MEITTSEFTEESYKLESIDIENSYLLIEENTKYITDFQNYTIYIEDDFDKVCKKVESGYALVDPETKYILEITEEQYEIIKDILE